MTVYDSLMHKSYDSQFERDIDDSIKEYNEHVEAHGVPKSIDDRNTSGSIAIKYQVIRDSPLLTETMVKK